MVQTTTNPYITRKLEGKILKYLESPEIIAIVGPRQSGKTTMLKHIFERFAGEAIFLTFEDIKILETFEKKTNEFIETYVTKYRYIFIDEFQYAKNGGKILKYIFDTTQRKIVISGSSAIDLTVHAIKYLVGRIFVFNLFPLDFEEFLSFKDQESSLLYQKYRFETTKSYETNYNKIGESSLQKLKNYSQEYAIFGGYPRVVTSPGEDEKKEVLKNIYNTYFLREVKDILGLIDDYRLTKLIKSLALQVGGLVNYCELGQVSELSYPTLKKYLNFLEKTFVSFFVRPYFKNKRKEIVKNPKVYFWDSGLRNHVVEDFTNLEGRQDKGLFLENLVASELIKREWPLNFWRTKKGAEVDFVVSLPNSKKIALEVKYQLGQADFTSQSVREFLANYPDIPLQFLYYQLSEGFSNNDNLDVSSLPLIFL